MDLALTITYLLASLCIGCAIAVRWSKKLETLDDYAFAGVTMLLFAIIWPLSVAMIALGVVVKGISKLFKRA